MTNYADEKIRFVASVPTIQSAIQLSGEGSARIKLDVPESDLAQVLRLMTLRGKAFVVTVEPLE